MSRGPGGGEELLTVLEFQAAGLTPPVALGVLAFHGREFNSFGGRNPFAEMILFACLGWFVWGIFATAIWSGVVGRFNKLHAREPHPGRPPSPGTFPAPDEDLPRTRKHDNDTEKGPHPGP
jgi:hypothetical protein